MNRLISKLIIAVLMTAPGSPLLAQSDACGKPRNVGTGTLDELTWRQLNAVYEKVGEERWDEAHGDLLKMLGRSSRDRYLQAIINQALAQVEWSRENYDSALQYF